MKTYIVAQTEFQTQLLRRLLDTQELPEHTVLRGGKFTMALSLGSSLLSQRSAPVAVVMDADSVEPHKVREHEAELEYLLPAGNFGGILADVLMAVPQVEAVLFSDPEALECVLGRPLTEREKIEGEFRPRAVLDRLLAEAGMDGDTFLARINAKAAARFVEQPRIRSLVQFVQEAASAVTAAAA
ncbi:MAG TPA: hypothetical protein VLK84_27015 [Longimicrobium sp.]|nr:hypothetical protein [Longimicrobium sp.]